MEVKLPWFKWRSNWQIIPFLKNILKIMPGVCLILEIIYNKIKLIYLSYLKRCQILRIDEYLRANLTKKREV